ncbi:MAG TPA: hypothetical protein VK595_08595, partial [Vicinamibacterales bacterium]|nr:hypothetical protein [Vicinamibacterales bacterium]
MSADRDATGARTAFFAADATGLGVSPFPPDADETGPGLTPQPEQDPDATRLGFTPGPGQESAVARQPAHSHPRRRTPNAAALPRTGALSFSGESANDLVGQSLGSRYRVLRLLGAGGMGAVYEAFDLDLGVAVALKTVRPEIAADP